MSECDLNTLNQSSRNTVAIIIIAAIIGSGLGGWALGRFLTRPGDDTELVVTVDEDFFLDIEYVMPLDIEEPNCSSLLVSGQLFNEQFYNVVLDWLEDDPERVYDEETILDDTGLDEFQFGMHFEYITDEFGFWATEDSRLNGKTFTVSFGNNAVLLCIGVGVYIEESFDLYQFTFNGTLNLVEAIDEETAGYANFTNGNVLTGKNTMTIHGLTVVEEGILLDIETALNVTFNGDDYLMPLSTFGFP